MCSNYMFNSNGLQSDVTQLFSIRQCECGTECSYVSEMEEGCFVEVFDLGCIVKVGSIFTPRLVTNR